MTCNLIDQKNNFSNNNYDYGTGITADHPQGGNGSTDWNGNGKKEIDCSNLVIQMLNRDGYNIPYENTAALNNNSKYFDVIDAKDVQPGDIVLWQGARNHVGVVETYDPIKGRGTFFGSQSSTGPATTIFGKNTKKGWAMEPVKFLRPKKEYQTLPETCPTPPSAPNKFDAAQKFVQRFGDPLTLDLNGDGINTIPLMNPPILFDHTGTGIKTGTGWIAPDDGFLVLDRNGNGTIDNGTELFGDNTPVYDAAGNIIGKAKDGFDALAQLDTNHDGVVDAQDANFYDLQVWQDLNQDGISQAGELRYLADDLNITSINVSATQHSQMLPSGNQMADLGTFTRADGSVGNTGTPQGMADINLAADSFHRTFTTLIPLTVAAQSLLDMQGSGRARAHQLTPCRYNGDEATNDADYARIERRAV